MNRRLLRRVAFVLVAAQFLCAPPAVRALAAVTTPHPDNAHCAELMSPGDSDCACCRDGNQSVAVCLSSCTATVGAIPSFDVPATRVTSFRVPARPPAHLASLADPPLKPPPIV